MTRDGVAGLICLALAIGMLVLTRGLPQSSFVPIGPDFYPRIVLVIMAVLSVMLIASDLLSRRARATAASGAQPAPEARNYWLVGITFAVFAGYVVLLPLVGYRLATFLFMAALQTVFETPRGARRWIVVLVSALATTILTYVVFEHYLSVLLPRGSWTGW
jgi:hypothetical protein